MALIFLFYSHIIISYFWSHKLDVIYSEQAVGVLGAVQVDCHVPDLQQEVGCFWAIPLASTPNTFAYKMSAVCE